MGFPITRQRRLTCPRRPGRQRPLAPDPACYLTKNEKKQELIRTGEEFKLPDRCL